MLCTKVEKCFTFVCPSMCFVCSKYWLSNYPHLACLPHRSRNDILSALLLPSLNQFWAFSLNSQLGLSPFSISALHFIPLLILRLSREANFVAVEVILFFFNVSPNARDFIAPKAALPSFLLSRFRTFKALLRSVATAHNASTSFSSSGDFTSPFFWRAVLV